MSERSWRETHNARVAKILWHLTRASNDIQQAQALLMSEEQEEYAAKLDDPVEQIAKHSKAVRRMLC